MAKPEIRGTGPNLKTRGTSSFWIVGTNISPGNEVTVFVGGTEKWSGSIVAEAGGRYRANVTPVSEGKGGYGDLEDVTITVTNSDGTSDPHGDQVVVDGP